MARFGSGLVRRVRFGSMLLLAVASACGNSSGNGGLVDSSTPDAADIDTSSAACTSCHGRDGSAAPPLDLHGHDDPAGRGVGAHTVHLWGNTLGADIPCESCHVVPGSVDDTGHNDTEWPAEITFSGLAASHDLVPSTQVDDPDDQTASLTCSSTYCHGATLTGGIYTEPRWNPPDQRATHCDACHGNPPPGPHPAQSQCSLCHARVAAPDGSILDRALHVDGTVQVELPQACDACHGSTETPAPPPDLSGSTNPDRPGVGMHRSHLFATHDLSAPVACEQCHVVPVTVDAPGHLDDGTLGAELSFGALAGTGDASPAYDAEGHTCSSVYCHGATLVGGSVTTPLWTDDAAQAAACGACHGVPPPAPHVHSLECGLCHSATATGLAIVHPEHHVNGVVDVDTGLACTTCHGSADDPAPPADTTGGTATVLVTVGAHQSHLKAASGLTVPIACDQCHLVPATADAPDHIDAAPAELAFGALATADGATPAWSHDGATCSSVYCHGATLAGGAHTNPMWTKVDGTQDTCGSCHGVPPPAPHTQSVDCGMCHTATASGMSIAHPDKHIDGVVEVTTGQSCHACHGSDTNDAPPLDTAGNTSTALKTVGAHQAHLRASSSISAPIACAECHVVPATVDVPTHIDTLPAEVTFGDLARTGELQPAWDADDGTCSSTYCHGATLAGGELTTPLWTKVDGSQDACGSCHGVPPPAPHVQTTECGLCHSETASGMTISHPEKHVDGEVQVAALQSCHSCHGSPANDAPPVDTQGGADTVLVTIGAHQQHLLAQSGLSLPVQCEQCHVRPTAVDQPGHIDPEPSELTFGDLAAADGATPQWDRLTATCSSVYCHGATLGGGVKTQPVWTQVDHTQDACGACHGLPPPAPHVQRVDCGMCHSATANGMAVVHPERHIDGVVDLTLEQACNACHGSNDNAAPPSDLSGGQATALVTVGAHQSHLQGASGLASPVACTECHVVPATVVDDGHLGAPPAEVTFGALATARGAKAAWSTVDATCSSVYCHGATLHGGTDTVPQWTTLDNTQDACGACHGIPPPAPHVQNLNCGLCHPATAQGTAVVHPEKHVDGVLDVTTGMSCHACHGSDDNAAPPIDTAGGTLTSLTTVGAHQAHVRATAGISSPLECTECHVTPSDVGDPGHVDGPPAEITFGELARTSGSSPTWDRVTATCSSTYCHGASLDAGGTVTTPEWTTLDGTQATCGACHGVPPPLPHVQADDCGACHTETAQGATIAHPERHVDGVLQVAGSQSCDACHGNADNAAPPFDTEGGSATTLVTVGAHQSHLMASGGISKPVACTECHVRPAAVSDAGHLDPAPAEVTFGDLATTGGVQPSWNRDDATCSSTYCHGASLQGGTIPSPVWTLADGSQEACDACHGAPPPAPHAQTSDCGLCHGGTASGMTITHPDKHVDGVLQVSSFSTCSACHGSDDNPAPPTDTAGGSSTSLVTVGAHQPHLRGSSSLTRPLDCTACHVEPTTINDPGHIDARPAEVTFGALAEAAGATPTWDAATGTCSSVYCHGASLSGGTVTTPVWTLVDNSADACGACHGVPPPLPHAQRTNCGLCHSATARGMAIINLDRHLDGMVEVDANQACTTCHGGPDNAAPPRDTEGGEATALRTVGAHQSHLRAASGLAAPLECSACHVTPAAVGDAGHVDPAPAEVTFGTVAHAHGSSPTWTTADATCSAVYCHGATLSGGYDTTPRWTRVDGTQAACGTCHGIPPAAPHVPSDNCGACHSASATGSLITTPARHVDGVLDVDDPVSCVACHGSAANAAPPADTLGRSDATLTSVGAHQAHLGAPSHLSSPVACEQCHAVPATPQAPGHIDVTPAEVSFGDLATANGATPAWQHASASCSTTYCHGATLTGGALTTPQWTRLDGAQAACGACHGVPPPAPHVQSEACGLCHSATATGDAIAHPEHHVDGTADVDANQACNACHGSTVNAAPPSDTSGGGTASLVTVGAHQAHLLASSGLAAPVACSECHVVPATTLSAGHVDPAPAEVTFGRLATSANATPAWNRATGACSTTYCHGATLAGGTLTAPVWTKTDGTQDACGSCHAVPPPAPHVADADCGKCHPATALAATIAHPDKHVDGTVEVSMPTTCNACHGGPGNAAPPLDTTGGSSAVLTTVGAHQPHLLASSALSSPVACAECHAVPSTVNATGHIDASPAEVAFGALATTDGATPTWARATNTCSSVYCHGATLAGGTRTVATWNRIDGTQDTCGSCHGLPPPAPHVQSTNCGMCHSATTDGATIAHPARHIDGVVDVDAIQACNACHGSAANDAPPKDTDGGTSTLLKTVGAHQAHVVAASSLAAPIGCAECHVVPPTVTADGHIDAAPAEIAFGLVAKADGAAPAWNSATAVCSSTYCHGATLEGGNVTAPVWTKVDGSQDTCASCHGNPPPAPHVQSSDCGQCHPATATGGAVTTPAKHVNGTLDVDMGQTCNTCHGSADNAAPPVDTTNGSATSLITVGAHQSHLRDLLGIAAPVACNECHVVPLTGADAGHVDVAPAEVTFGLIAKADGAAPTWSRATARCSSTYCHGATLDAGGTTPAPLWTRVDGTQATCTSCHGNPPPAPHVQSANCGMCHSATATGGAITHRDRHVNGTVEVDANQACDSCHGGATSDAPPVDTTGGSATTLVTVGAHQPHLKASSGLSSPVACAECHVRPTATTDAGHIDPAPAELTFGAQAKADGATPTWSRGTATCSSTYCHGATLNAGGTVTEPVWTKVDGTQDACGDCHGVPPPAPHVQNTDCGLCHSATATGALVTNVANHVNGVLDVDAAQACNACHGSPTNDAPPLDTAGGTATTLVTVGAHQAHVQATAGLASPLGCTACHVTPAATTDAGHIDPAPAELTFGSLARADGATPSWSRVTGTCSSTYCHGATLNAGGTATTPVWTKVDGTQGACSACHGNPPAAPHVAMSNCGLCHPATATGGAISHPEKHVNGTVEVAMPTACNACHGGVANDAPPVDTTGASATTLKTVGAHQPHLLASSGLSSPVECTECHVSPATVDAAGHIDASPAEIAFGSLAKADGAAPAWNASAATCSSTYCHGATLGAGGSATTPVWTKVDNTQDTCAACHGNPPPAPHTTSTQCATCHPATMNANGTIKTPAMHIDGTVDVVASACNTCHGGAVNAAPPLDTTDGSATTLTTVGAHQPHLLASSSLSVPVACTECHVVPAAMGDAGHVDASPAEVTFGTFTRTGGLTPTWTRATNTCASTYCHGASLNAGGTATAPVWTRVDGTQDTCTSCHGNPPPSPHVASTACASCHTTTMNANGTIKTPSAHIDGTVEVITLTCSSCHGSATNDAPPLDTTGGTLTTLTTVGAHQPHLLASSGIASPVACTECHVVPAAMGAAGHLDASPAEVTFGTFTRTDGLTPSWTRATNTCASTYCHGASLNAGGTVTAPVWTKVDGTQDACTSCHGNPPPSPHVASTACANCHTTTMNANGTIKTPSAHINGTVEVITLACNSCHGSATNNAPPVDTTGASATTLTTVGAHQPHLLGSSNLSTPIACAQCHVVPAAMGDAGHLDASPAEVTFGALAKTGTLTPTWTRTTNTCASTYCHGGSLTLVGGSNKTPNWVTVNNTQDACGTCHANATASMTRPHPVGAAGSTCATCHGTVAASNTALANKALHVNGTVEVAPASGTLACNGVCHGTATGTSPANQAPPYDTQNQTAVTLKSVGDHQNHLTATAAISAAMACNECHPVPTAVAGSPHLNKTVDVSFTIGTLSKKVTTTTYSATNATCTASYCHGGWTNSGKSTTYTSETWTTGTALTGCTNRCHGLPPSTGRHTRSDHLVACGRCHAAVANTSTPNGILATTAARALHINGNPDVQMSGSGTWNATTRSCDPSCHGAETWGARVLPL